MKNKTTTTLVGAGVSGAVVGLILWGLHEFGKIDVPDEVASWITIIIGVIFGWLAGERVNGVKVNQKKP